MVATVERKTDQSGLLLRQPGRPLDELKAELKRQRDLLADMERFLAVSKKSRKTAGRLANSLAGSLQKRLRFQEDVFLQLLAAKATPEDGLDALLMQARALVSDLQAEIGKTALGLEELGAGGIMTHRSGENLRRFCFKYRRYLSVTMSILVPLAAIRFEQNELDSLAVGLAEVGEDAIP